MKAKIFSFLVAMTSTAVIAENNLDWSTSSMSPINKTTIRVFDVEFAPTPNVSYNINFIFNEATLRFEPDPQTIAAIDKTKYATADPVRGGLLYDKWWAVNGQPEPSGNHALYPATGSQTGSTTWRCKECHGWDYKGKDGAYATGSSHFTGINGIFDARNKTVGEIYNAIARKNMPLSDQDILDLTKFIKESLIDMDKYIIFSGAQSKTATGNVSNGNTLYTGGLAGCSGCHGADGLALGGETVGELASDVPWELLHKIRFGHPGSAMPSMIENGLTLEEMVDILTYGQTLPQ